MIEQSKRRVQGTLHFLMIKQMETFSFNPPRKLAEEGKWLLAVTSFEAANSAFNITDENISSPISSPSSWTPEDGEELIAKLNKLLELRSENNIELHVGEVEKRGTRIELENSGYNLACFDHFKIRSTCRIKNSKT